MFPGDHGTKETFNGNVVEEVREQVESAFDEPKAVENQALST